MTFHIVRTNEKIEKILSIYQIKIEELKKLNPQIKYWDRLLPGMKLRLPNLTNQLNDEIDDLEPFIEDYYPKINFNNYSDNSTYNKGNDNNSQDISHDNQEYSNNSSHEDHDNINDDTHPTNEQVNNSHPQEPDLTIQPNQPTPPNIDIPQPPINPNQPPIIPVAYYPMYQIYYYQSQPRGKKRNRGPFTR